MRHHVGLRTTGFFHGRGRGGKPVVVESIREQLPFSCVTCVRRHMTGMPAFVTKYRISHFSRARRLLPRASLPLKLRPTACDASAPGLHRRPFVVRRPQTAQSRSRPRPPVYPFSRRESDVAHAQSQGRKRRIRRHRGNTQSPPDEIVCFKLDFIACLDSLPRRDRGIAVDLMIGERTRDVANKYGLNPARVAQKRREYCLDWRTFCGELLAAPAPSSVVGVA